MKNYWQKLAQCFAGLIVPLLIGDKASADDTLTGSVSNNIHNDINSSVPKFSTNPHFVEHSSTHAISNLPSTSAVLRIEIGFAIITLVILLLVFLMLIKRKRAANGQ